MTGPETIAIAAGEADQRLDRWFKRRFPGLVHGRLERLLRTGQIRVDGRRAKAGLRLRAGQAVRVPPGLEADPSEGRETAMPRLVRKAVGEADARFIRSLVIYKDNDIIALDKPAGLAVQGGSGTARHIDGLLDALRFEAAERPRLVHRLDRDTSGVLVVARNARAAAHLADSFRQKSARKLYWALVAGQPRPRQGRIDLALAKEAGPKGERVAGQAEAGKRALTLYVTQDAAGDRAAWLVLRPLTGRTHQLRVHCAEALGTPIVGDGKYGTAASWLSGGAIAAQLHLHARTLVVPHPAGGELRVSAPLPPHMRASWEFLGFDPEAEVDPFS
ncbi:MAG: RluA family pseudouridine synthase [Pseudomonadota bacterium]